jgi:hypothetical protein
MQAATEVHLITKTGPATAWPGPAAATAAAANNL